MGVDAVILAGAKNDGLLASSSSKEYEALIEIAGKEMVKYIIDVLKRVDMVDQIIVVGPQELEKFAAARLVLSKGSLLENIKLGLNATNTPYNLILSSDIPLISVEAINSFLSDSKRKKSDFYYPIIPKKLVELDFPKTKKSYFSLTEGVFTGGNIFLINKKALLDLEDLIIKILKWRKTPWKLAYLLGFKFIVKLLTGTLSLPLIENQVHKLTAYHAKGVILNYPEVGFDIDKPKQLALAKEILSNSAIKANYLFTKH